MKVWYDKKARYREFNPGDKVLVHLPIHGNIHYRLDTVALTQLSEK